MGISKFNIQVLFSPIFSGNQTEGNENIILKNKNKTYETHKNSKEMEEIEMRNGERKQSKGKISRETFEESKELRRGCVG